MDRRPRTGRKSRVTTLVRVLLGAGLLAGGWQHFGDPLALAHSLSAPLSTALWLVLGEVALGFCLAIGLFSRWCGLATLAGTLWVGAVAGPSGWAILALIGGGYLSLRGGGAYSIDGHIGLMQRRASERELAKPGSAAGQGQPREGETV